MDEIEYPEPILSPTPVVEEVVQVSNVPKGASLFTLFKNERFQVHFKKAIQVGLSDSIITSFDDYSNIRGLNITDKVETVLKHFTETSEAIRAIDGRIKSVEIEIAEINGKITALEYVIRNGDRETCDVPADEQSFLLIGGSAKTKMRGIIHLFREGIIAKEEIRQKLLQEKVNLI